MGHPWPSAAKPASMPVYPLRRTSTRPLEGARKSKAISRSNAKARRPDSRPDCRFVRYPIVGASLLAMDFQATRSSRQGALSLTSIASRLAPTGDWRYLQKSGRLSGRLALVFDLGAPLTTMAGERACRALARHQVGESYRQSLLLTVRRLKK